LQNAVFGNAHALGVGAKGAHAIHENCDRQARDTDCQPTPAVRGAKGVRLTLPWQSHLCQVFTKSLPKTCPIFIFDRYPFCVET
jgi:hypothetical protein